MQKPYCIHFLMVLVQQSTEAYASESPDFN